MLGWPRFPKPSSRYATISSPSMQEAEVLPIVEARSSGERIVMRIIRIAGMGESDVEQLVAPIYRAFSNPVIMPWRW